MECVYGAPIGLLMRRLRIFIEARMYQTKCGLQLGSKVSIRAELRVTLHGCFMARDDSKAP